MLHITHNILYYRPWTSKHYLADHPWIIVVYLKKKHIGPNANKATFDFIVRETFFLENVDGGLFVLSTSFKHIKSSFYFCLHTFLEI